MTPLSKTNKSMIFFGVFIFSVASVFLHLEIPCATMLLALILVCNFKKIITRTFSIILMTTFLAGIIHTNYKIPQADILSGYIPNNANIQGIVTSIPTYKNHKIKFELKADKLVLQDKTLTGSLGKTIVYLKNPNIPIEIGDKIILEGNLTAPFKVENQYQFDYEKYLQKSGIFSVFYAENAHFLSKNTSKNFAIKNYFHKLSIKIQNKHLEKMNNKNANLLGGIVFGNRTIKVDKEIAEDFRNAGIYHVLSASGLHVGIVLLFWTYFMKFLRMPFSFILGSGALVLLVFGGFTGFPPAVCRAIFMAEFVILGKLLNRQANSIALLALVAFLMLLYNPLYIVDIGFQLSFITTFGIFFCLPFMLKNFNFKPEFISGPMFLTATAQIFSAPLLIYYFHSLPIYSLLANLFIVPIISIITFTGFFANIIAIFPKTDKIIELFDYFLTPFLSTSALGANFFANLPYSVFFVKQISISSVILMYIFIIFTILCIKKSLKSKLYNSISICSFILLLFFNLNLSPKTLDITVFSLGNSDAILVELPNKKILIDTGKITQGGSSSGKTIINNYLKANAINTLDAIILTHPDSDHIGGCCDILDEIKVKHIYQPQIESNSILYSNLQNKIKAQKIATNNLRPNTSLCFDKDKLKIIAPSGNDTNSSSLLTYLEFEGFSALFMGDAEKEALPIIKQNNINNVDLLKIGHHGSKNAIDNQMLNRLNPQKTVICSKKNDKNHPHPQTTRLLTNRNIKTYDTATYHMLQFSYNPKEKSTNVSHFNSETKKMTTID